MVSLEKIPPEFIQKYGLTPREAEIIIVLSEGKSYQKISKELFVSFKTVATHFQNIYRKTAVNKKDDLLDLLRGFAQLKDSAAGQRFLNGGI